MADWGRIWKSFDKAELNGTTYMFEYYKDFVGSDFRGMKVLEIGCGTGVNSILMASLGARVSVMAYSKDAVEVVKRMSRGLGIKLIHQNMFTSRLEGEFDLVHSEGVVEHYLMPRRQQVLDIHAKAARKDGRVLIIVPNAKCPAYRLGKRLAEATGTWIYGNEYPYTERELVHRMKRSGLKYEKSLGGELLLSLGWALAPMWLSRYGSILRKGFAAGVNRRFYEANYNNPLANRWGRAIGVLGTKI
jgi:2-polyprenyl-3-methyl-5-hydroxy-6-metoxy-1,4-benzoquinol methylase